MKVAKQHSAFVFVCLSLVLRNCRVSAQANRNFDVRLINAQTSAKTPTEGRLEIFYNGTWGTICDDRFTDASARVACSSLGFGYVGVSINNRHGGGTGQIWLDEVACVGNERSIDRCSHNGWGTHNCNHSEDVSISCAQFGTTRLINAHHSGGNPTEGRLEIYYNGTWGTVCDDRFSHASARVACASLGFGYIGVYLNNRFGSGTGRIWLDEVECEGFESGISECRHDGFGSNNCGHYEDVSISCVSTTTTTRSTVATTPEPESSSSVTTAAASTSFSSTTNLSTSVTTAEDPAHLFTVTTRVSAPNATGGMQMFVVFGIFGVILLVTIILLSAVILRINWVQSAALSTITKVIFTWSDTNLPLQSLKRNNPVYEVESDHGCQLLHTNCFCEMNQKLCDI